jgi:fructose-bisphosphate aldolase class II
VWAEMVDFATDKGWKKGDYKKLNLPFENKLLGQPGAVRARMVSAVEEFTYGLLTEVFNAADTAPLAIEAILSAGSFDPGPKVGRIEDPHQWTKAKIAERAAAIDSDKGPAGDFDD